MRARAIVIVPAAAVAELAACLIVAAVDVWLKASAPAHSGSERIVRCLSLLGLR